MAKLLSTVLSAFDVGKIIVVDDADKALTEIKHNKPDCVFLDWLRADKKELSFAKFIRRADSSPDKTLPIILCTGHTDIRKIIAARDCGVTEIIAKPMSANQILTKMDAALFKRREFVETDDYVGPDRRRRAMPYTGPERRGKYGLHQDQIDEIVNEEEGETVDG